MRRGLEGRRIALAAGEGADAAVIRRELIAAGAEISELADSTPDEEWHGGRYAGLVLAGRSGAGTRDRLAQLVREFLVSEKPVAAMGADLAALQLDESLLALGDRGDDAQAFARRVATTFAERLEEHDVDEMSELSFPASDPPAMNPGTAGHVSAEPDPRAD